MSLHDRFVGAISGRKVRLKTVHLKNMNLLSPEILKYSKVIRKEKSILD